MKIATMTVSSRKPGLGFDNINKYLNRYLLDKKDANPRVEWKQSTLLFPGGRNDDEMVMVTLTVIITTDE